MAAYVAALMLSMATNVEATPITSLLDASLTTGSLQGTNFTVSLSYDSSSLTGQGQEFLSLLSFDFTLLGTQFARSDIKQGGQVIFQDGTLENVTAAFFPPPPAGAPVPDIAFGFGGPGVIGYLDSNGEFGGGSYSFVSETVTPPPVLEPATACSLALGLGAFLVYATWSHRRPQRTV